MKPPSQPPGTRVRLWFWRPGGAGHIIVAAPEAAYYRERLIAEGATVWHSEVLPD